MLQGSSQALLECDLLQRRVAAGGKGGAPPAPGRGPKPAAARGEGAAAKEARAARSEQLRRVGPVEMTPDNFARSMYCFGVAGRRAIDHMFYVLVQYVRRLGPPTEEAEGGGALEGRREEGPDGLPFEAFYLLMRTLHEGPTPPPFPRLQHAGAAAATSSGGARGEVSVG